MRKLRKDEVRFDYTIGEEDTPVRGNFMASGDDEQDKKDEDEVLERLKNGDVFAWFYITVRCNWTSPSGCPYVGYASLGCCNESPDATAEGIAEGIAKEHGLEDEALDHLNQGIEKAVKERYLLEETLRDDQLA